MAKNYLLVNRQEGPRGIQTELGTVMVSPAPKDAKAGVVATLTDDEVELAKSIPLEVEEVQGGNITGEQDPTLPADGQNNPNSGVDPVEVKTGTDNDKSDEGSSSTSGSTASGSTELPSLSGMNKTQLLEQAGKENVTVKEDATNAEIVAAIEAKRAQ